MINLWILGMPCLWTNQFRNRFPTDLRPKLTKTHRFTKQQAGSWNAGHPPRRECGGGSEPSPVYLERLGTVGCSQLCRHKGWWRNQCPTSSAVWCCQRVTGLPQPKTPRKNFTILDSQTSRIISKIIQNHSKSFNLQATSSCPRLLHHPNRPKTTAAAAGAAPAAAPAWSSSSPPPWPRRPHGGRSTRLQRRPGSGPISGAPPPVFQVGPTGGAGHFCYGKWPFIVSFPIKNGDFP